MHHDDPDPAASPVLMSVIRDTWEVREDPRDVEDTSMRRTSRASRSATGLALGRASAVSPVEPHPSPLIRSAQDATLCLYWLLVESHRTARIYTRSRNKETVTSLILEINK